VAHVVLKVHGQELVDLGHKLVAEVCLQVLVDLLVLLRVFLLNNLEDLLAVWPKLSEDALKPPYALLHLGLLNLVGVKVAHAAVCFEGALASKFWLLIHEPFFFWSCLLLCCGIKYSLSFSFLDLLLKCSIYLLWVLVVPKLIKGVSVHQLFSYRLIMLTHLIFNWCYYFLQFLVIKLEVFTCESIRMYDLELGNFFNFDLGIMGFLRSDN